MARPVQVGGNARSVKPDLLFIHSPAGHGLAGFCFAQLLHCAFIQFAPFTAYEQFCNSCPANSICGVSCHMDIRAPGYGAVHFARC